MLIQAVHHHLIIGTNTNALNSGHIADLPINLLHLRGGQRPVGIKNALVHIKAHTVVLIVKGVGEHTGKVGGAEKQNDADCQGKHHRAGALGVALVVLYRQHILKAKELLAQARGFQLLCLFHLHGVGLAQRLNGGHLGRPVRRHPSRDKDG